jgi:hypothetical protein
MKLLSLTVQFLVLAFVAVAEEQQECEVGGDGTCIEELLLIEAIKDPVVIDKNCPDRGHIIRCTGATLDLNKNGKLDRVELDSAINSLPWYARGIVKLLGNTDKMMKKCDMDHDDAISMDYDMLHNQDTCLATCFKRKAFKHTFFPDCKL